MIARVVILTVLLHMAFSGIRMTASLDALAHRASELEVGVLMGLIAFCPMLLAIVCGRWIDRVGPKLPLIVSCVVLVVGGLIPTVIPAKTSGLAPLYAACALIGIGFLSVQLACQQLVGHLATPATRTGAFSMLAMGYAASGLLSPLVSGYMIDHFGFQWAFASSLALTGIGIVLFAVIYRHLPDAWEGARKKAAQGKTWELLRIADVRNALLVSALVSMAWDLQHFMFPVYGHAIGLSASEIGWLVATFFAASFLVRFALPFLSRHLTEWTFLLGVFVIATGCYAVFPLLDGLTSLMVLAFVLGLGLGASQPNVMSLLHSQTPPGRVGEVLGIRTMLLNASHTGLPVVFGALMGVVGVAWIFWSMAALMGVAAASVARRNRLAARAARPSTD